MKNEKTLESILGILDKAREENSISGYSLDDANNLIDHSQLFSSVMDETETTLVEMRLHVTQEDIKDLWHEMILDYPEDVDEYETEQLRLKLRQLIDMDKKLSAYLNSRTIAKTELVV